MLGNWEEKEEEEEKEPEKASQLEAQKAAEEYVLEDLFENVTSAEDIKTQFEALSDDKKQAFFKVMLGNVFFQNFIKRTDEVLSFADEVLDSFEITRLGEVIDGARDIMVRDLEGESFSFEVELMGEKFVIKSDDSTINGKEIKVNDKNVGLRVAVVIEFAIRSTEEQFFEELEKEYKQRKSIDQLIEEGNFPLLLKKFKNIPSEYYIKLYELQYSDGRHYSTFLHQLFESDNSNDNILLFLNYIKANTDQFEYRDYLTLRDSQGRTPLQSAANNTVVNRRAVVNFLQPPIKETQDMEIDTHTESVHSSVNESFIRLKDAFLASGKEISKESIDSLIRSANQAFIDLSTKSDQDLFEYIKPTLPQSDRNLDIADQTIVDELKKVRFYIDASLRLFNDVINNGRLSSNQSGYLVRNDERDPTIGLTYKQMLAISYFALNDSNHLTAGNGHSPASKILQYAYHLCGIRRQYNEGDIETQQPYQENPGEDLSKCAGGMVNHLILALVGINKLAEIKFITYDVIKNEIASKMRDFISQNIKLIIDRIEPEEQRKFAILKWKLKNKMPEELYKAISENIGNEMIHSITEEIAQEYGRLNMSISYEGILRKLPYGGAIYAAIDKAVDLKNELLLDVAKMTYLDLRKIYQYLPCFIYYQHNQKAYIKLIELSMKKLEESWQEIDTLLASLSFEKEADLLTVFNIISLKSNDPKIQAYIKSLSAVNVNKFLDYAIKISNMEAVETIMLHNDNISLEKKGELLILIAAQGRLIMVKALIDDGANVNARDLEGKAALHWAAMRGHAAVVKALIDDGADINARDVEGNTALHRAVAGNKVAVVEVILKASSLNIETARSMIRGSVNLSWSMKSSFLRFAAQQGDIEMVEALIKHGAEIDAIDAEGNTALHYSAMRGNAAVVKALIDDGADVNARDVEGRTVLQVAEHNNHTDVQRLIELSIFNAKRKKAACILVVAVIGTGIAVGKTYLDSSNSALGGSAMPATENLNSIVTYYGEFLKSVVGGVFGALQGAIGRMH